MPLALSNAAVVPNQISDPVDGHAPDIAPGGSNIACYDHSVQRGSGISDSPETQPRDASVQFAMASSPASARVRQIPCNPIQWPLMLLDHHAKTACHPCTGHTPATLIVLSQSDQTSPDKSWRSAAMLDCRSVLRSPILHETTPRCLVTVPAAFDL